MDTDGYFGFINDLERNGYRRIGEGSYSKVFGRDDDSDVIKVGSITSRSNSGLKDRPDAWLRYANYALAHPGNPHFPVIRKLNVHDGWYDAQMERLEHPSSAVVRAQARTLNHAPYETSERDALPPSLRSAMEEIEAARIGDWDLGWGNYLSRNPGTPDETLVLTDPVY